jgi:hypothetical protein
LLVDGTMDNHVQSAIDSAVPDGMQEGEDAGEEALDGDGHEGIGAGTRKAKATAATRVRAGIPRRR